MTLGKLLPKPVQRVAKNKTAENRRSGYLHFQVIKAYISGAGGGTCTRMGSLVQGLPHPLPRRTRLLVSPHRRSDGIRGESLGCPLAN